MTAIIATYTKKHPKWMLTYDSMRRGTRHTHRKLLFESMEEAHDQSRSYVDEFIESHSGSLFSSFSGPGLLISENHVATCSLYVDKTTNIHCLIEQIK